MGAPAQGRHETAAGNLHVIRDENVAVVIVTHRVPRDDVWQNHGVRIVRVHERGQFCRLHRPHVRSLRDLQVGMRGHHAVPHGLTLEHQNPPASLLQVLQGPNLASRPAVLNDNDSRELGGVQRDDEEGEETEHGHQQPPVVGLGSLVVIAPIIQSLEGYPQLGERSVDEPHHSRLAQQLVILPVRVFREEHEDRVQHEDG